TEQEVHRMPYKQTTTGYVVQLVPLRPSVHSVAMLSRCQAVRAEARRLQTALVQRYVDARAQDQWLSAGDLEPATKGGQYALHSQNVQALCQKFAATAATFTTRWRSHSCVPTTPSTWRQSSLLT